MHSCFSRVFAQSLRQTSLNSYEIDTMKACPVAKRPDNAGQFF
jgi:hypothetical protein